MSPKKNDTTAHGFPIGGKGVNESAYFPFDHRRFTATRIEVNGLFARARVLLQSTRNTPGPQNRQQEHSLLLSPLEPSLEARVCAG
jgi:hypothetical protein